MTGTDALRDAVPHIKSLMDELHLKPLEVSYSECYGIVERWKGDDGNLKYGRDLAEYIGAEGDETAARFAELIVLTLNVLPELLTTVAWLDAAEQILARMAK